MRKALHYIGLVLLYHIFPVRGVRKRVYDHLLDKFGVVILFSAIRPVSFNHFRFRGVRVISKKGPAISAASIGFALSGKFFTALFKRKSKSANEGSALRKAINRVQNIFSKIEVSQLEAPIVRSGMTFNLNIEELCLTSEKFESLLHLKFNDTCTTLRVNAFKEGEAIRVVPCLIKSDIRNNISIADFSVSIKRGAKKTDIISFHMENLSFRERRFSPSKILIRKLEGDLQFYMDRKQIILQNESVICLNDCMDIYPVATYIFSSQTIKSSTLLDIAAATFLKDSRDLGLELFSISAEGNVVLQITWQFYLRHFAIDDFKISLVDNNISITGYGTFPLNKLSDEFSHVIYDAEGNAGFRIDEYGGSFIRFDDIPELYKQFVILAEDPEFYCHRGVAVNFIQNAINTNLKKRRFARGASTITMQLTRNLFLNHDRTVCKKASEVILSLIIENYLNVPKERILELYLNIIEFGNGVYGSHHASFYYFNKPLQELSLSELIVLIYIIPRPKHFDNALQEGSEKLRRNLKNFFYSFSLQAIGKDIISASNGKELTTKLHFFNYQPLDLQ